MSTGSRIRVAVVDSGVNAAHPHVGVVTRAVAVADDGSLHDDCTDRVGHGTAVIAAVMEKSPQSEFYAVKVFDRSLSTSVRRLVTAIRWAALEGARVINLSLGTPDMAHREQLAGAVEYAVERGAILVAARDDDGVRWLPGCLPRVLPVQVDWSCPRDEFRVVDSPEGRVFRASGFPREIPGVPPARNLNGISFAVANMSGFLARALEAAPAASLEEACGLLLQTSTPA